MYTTYTLRTNGPLIEPEPSRTATEKPFETVTDDPLSPRPSPLAGAWQCPGCGTIYNMTVNSCQCQVHRFTSNSTTFQFYDRAKPMGAGGGG